MTAVEIRSALEGLLKIVETMARHTPTAWDDQLAKVLNTILEVPSLFELLAYLLGDNDVQTLRDDERTNRIQQLAHSHAAGGISAAVSFSLILQYLPLIVRLMLSWLGRR